MRTYLREITIEVTNARTGVKVAESHSHRDSLSSMGSSWEEIVRRTADQLVDGASAQEPE